MNGCQAKAALIRHKIRPTQQRVAVYQYLLNHPEHPTADAIYQSLSAQYPVLSRTTIYNSLNALAKAGLIRIINIRAQEQRFDANNNDHGHFLCDLCKKIYDFVLSDRTLKSLCPAGFKFNSGDLYCTGICPYCGKSRY